MAKELRRRLAAVTPQDADGAGRPRLFAWGYGWIAWAARSDRQAVRDAIRNKRLDPADPVSVFAWVLERRGARELAQAVRAEFGL